MDIRDLLTLDHRETVKLAQLLGTSDNVDCCIAAQHRLVELIRSHAHGEQEIVYMAMQRAQPQQAAEFVDQARLEHEHVHALLAALAQAQPASPEWRRQARCLTNVLVRHIADEHERTFPLLTALCSTDAREQMSRRFLQLRSAAPWPSGGQGICPLARWCAQRDTVAPA
jgi:hemerythrin-like domain-containing protein